MKKTTKIWLMIGAFLVLIGALVFAGAMTLNGWDFSRLSNVKYETNTYEVSEAFENISFRTDTADIVFAPAEDGTCSVTVREQKKVKHDVAVQDGTLMVNTVDTRDFIDRLSVFDFDSPKITVYLPKTEYSALAIEEHTGDIEIPKGFRFQSIDVSADTGDVDCGADASGRIRIALSTGDVRAAGLTAGELALGVSTGRVELSSVDCGGNVSVTVDTGNTVMTDVSCRSFTSSGSTGKLTMKSCVAGGSFSIERSTGDVTFEKCDAAGLTVKTGTGDVTGTLLTEKVFLTQTGTGKVDVPGTVTGGKCEITTSTGDIRIGLAAGE